MKLLSVRVDHFRNIVDSDEVTIEDDTTCLVGKNESGKTSFLKALHLLKPTDGSKFDVHAQYPAWLMKKHRLRGKDLNLAKPVRARFGLEPGEQADLEEVFGPAGGSIEAFELTRNYAGEVSVDVHFDEASWVEHFLTEHSVAGLFPDTPPSSKALAEAIALGVADDSTTEEQSAQLNQLRAKLVEAAGPDQDIAEQVSGWLVEHTPDFLFFDNYSGLPGIIHVERISRAAYEDLKGGQQTAKALLEIAYADTNVATGADYERRKRELEHTANALTDDILAYWSQNSAIRVEIDFNQKAAGGNRPIVHELHVRMYDNEHMLSLPFDERSSGFRWFFSFLCAFSRYRMQDKPVIILLDEPALGLHARAQRDFLKFIEEQLAPSCQVIYSTHSPFMVPPEHLHRVRLVQDQGRRQGARVSADVLSTDRDTLFPLQGALGYDLAQNMLVGPHNLVVEGSSDLTYLQVLSSHLASLGLESLDPRWTIVPVGGADHVATFVALLGSHVDATVLLDSHPRGNQRIDDLVRQGIFERSRVLEVGSLVGQKEADIEDLFHPGEYLKLYNEAFNAKVALGDLQGSDTVVKQLARVAGVSRFDHGRPAQVLLRDQASHLASLGDNTLAAFERLFQAINATLSQ